MLSSKKLYYSIREVCDLTGLEPHVLRYWESEFSILRPKKNRAGNRAYREKDIETVKKIKHLLYDEQFTIPGARKKLSEKTSSTDETPDSEETVITPIEEAVPTPPAPEPKTSEAVIEQTSLFADPTPITEPGAQAPGSVSKEKIQVAINELREVLGILG